MEIIIEHQYDSEYPHTHSESALCYCDPEVALEPEGQSAVQKIIFRHKDKAPVLFEDAYLIMV